MVSYSSVYIYSVPDSVNIGVKIPEVLVPPYYKLSENRTENKVHHALDYHSLYSSRLKSLNLLPISYWFEIKDLTFYYICKSGGYEVDIDQYSTQPCLHTTRFSSSDLRRPNLCKSSTFRSSYFNTRIILLWNNLPSHIKSSNSCAICVMMVVVVKSEPRK
jgi:hypothetical protein